jgi:hypothetical protein
MSQSNSMRMAASCCFTPRRPSPHCPIPREPLAVCGTPLKARNDRSILRRHPRRHHVDAIFRPTARAGHTADDRSAGCEQLGLADCRTWTAIAGGAVSASDQHVDHRHQ